MSANPNVTAGDITDQIRLDDEHRYWVGDRQVPGVTATLQDAGLVDFSGVPPDVLEEARVRGTETHRATQLDDDGQLDERTLAENVRPRLQAWRDFRAERQFEPIVIEQIVYSQRHYFGGTLDRVGIVPPNRIILLDLKATYVIPRSVGPQTAAYQLAYNEGLETMPIDERWCVHLRADGRYEVHPLTDPMDRAVWLAALTLARWREGTL